MDVRTFVEAIGADFFTGVPDSLLKSLSSYLMDTYGLNPAHHVIAANEGSGLLPCYRSHPRCLYAK